MLNRLHVPLLEPEDVKRHLAKDIHWKPGYSAQQLVLAWSNSKDGFPDHVKSVLRTCPQYENAELIDGCFEREVDLGTAGRNSQTDLMVIAGIGKEIAIIAVEGKVDEPFGQVVSEWNDNSVGKITRLNALCATLGLDIRSIGHLRYQLLHRTVSAVYEAKRYRCRQALMLVHSFSPTKAWLADFEAFALAMGTGIKGSDLVSPAKDCEGVTTRLAWVSDKPQK
jgi:hypothetical protein